METAPTQVLVVGLGSIGQRHARLLQARSDTRVSLCDVSADHRREVQSRFEPRVREFSDYAEALKSRPDIVFLCTPNHLHAPMGLAAISAGADVLVEKPIADNSADGARLVEAAQRAARNLHVGYMLRFDPGLNAIRRMIGARDIGAVCAARAMVGTYVTLLNSRCNDKEMHPYSLVLDYTHEIDYVRWLLGEPRQVQAMGATIGALEKRPQPNVFQMTLGMESGAVVQIHLDYVQYPQRRGLEIFGDRGTLSYDFMTGEIALFASGQSECVARQNVGSIAQRIDDLFRCEHDAVLACRKGRGAPVVSGEDAVRTLEIAEKAIDSARSIHALSNAERPARF